MDAKSEERSRRCNRTHGFRTWYVQRAVDVVWWQSPPSASDITIARASPSTSSKLFCFTALIEHNHTLTVNETS